MNKFKLRKVLLITLIVIVSLLLVAVVIGALNATVGGGKWTLGWQTYKYDEQGFSVGGGTVYDRTVTAIDLDWRQGNVRILVTEDDAQVSLTEESEEDLATSAKLRWTVDENGCLIVKNRKSGTYFATAERKKDLVLRIPKSMASALTEVDVNVNGGTLTVKGLTVDEMEIESVSADVLIDQCEIRNLDVETVSGKLTLGGEVTNALTVESVSGELNLSSAACPNRTKLETVGGNVTLALPSHASFRLKYMTASGKLTSDFALSQNGEYRVHGSGDCSVHVETKSGDLALVFAE